MRLLKEKTNIDFMGIRKYAFGVSGALIIAALVALPTVGLNFGLDFTGGTEVEVRFNTAPDPVDVRAVLAEAGMGDAKVQTFGSPEEILVRIPPSEDGVPR